MRYINYLEPTNHLFIRLGTLLVLLIGLMTQYKAFSQAVPYSITGRVTESETGDPVPFANVVLQGTTIGTTTDFEGFYTIKTTIPADTLVVSYIGYTPRKKAIIRGKTQKVNFQLNAAVGVGFKEIEVTAGENPAYEIIRRAVRNRERNDPQGLRAYDYESYNKVEIDIDNIGEKFAKRPLMKQIKALVDSLASIAGEDGKPIIPIFISESISRYYYTKEPERTHEAIQKTKVTGVGLDDGAFVTNLIGSSFQQYNFYNSQIEILGKAFISPIATGWKFTYDMELADSLFIGEDWCYKIILHPWREADLAFNGAIWIAKEDYGIKRVDLTIGRQANVNFVNKIKIQQEWFRTRTGNWLPAKNRMLIDIAQLDDNWAGLLAKFYTSNKDFRINNEAPDELFAKPVEFAEDAREQKKGFWETNRHDTLTKEEEKMLKMIDTIKTLPVVKTYVEIVDIAINGYQRFGKIDVGPYLQGLAINNIEGVRMRMGFRTNSFFSKKWSFEPFLGYGTKDGRFKYGIGIDHVLSRKHWTVLKFNYSYDIDQVALLDNNARATSLFYAATKWADINIGRPFVSEDVKLTLEREHFKGFTTTTFVNYVQANPLFEFGHNIRESDGSISIRSGNFNWQEVGTNLRYARKEFLLEDNTNQRTSIYTRLSPVFNLRYIYGVGNFGPVSKPYHKITAGVNHYLNYGALGTGRYIIEGGIIPSELPYPLLKAHLGNPFLAYNQNAFNVMNYFEFVSDRWVSLSYQHNFEGLFTNSIPYFSKLNWRLLVQGKVLFGELSPMNKEFNRVAGYENAISYLDGRPYAEAGWGIENIFRFIRIDFIHRLTYLERPNVSPFGVRVGVQFKL